MNEALDLINMAEAFLFEANGEQSRKHETERALTAKRLLERAKLKLDILYNGNPGITGENEDLLKLLKAYRVNNGLAMQIILERVPLQQYTRFLTCLMEAEQAIERDKGGVKALAFYNEALALFNSFNKHYQQIPDTFSDRLRVLREYI